MNLQVILNRVIELTNEVAIYLKTEQSKITSEIIETKGKNDFVTYVDKTSEKIIVEKLKQILPQAGFITEENTENIIANEYNWIIDPLDGTTNFIHGLKPYAISIALQKNNETVLGVVYEIGANECFYATKNGGAFLNGNAINVSENSKLSNSIISTGFPYNNFSRLEKFLKSLKYFVENTHGVRRFGSAATDLAYIACGRFDAYYEYGLNSWDVAAGALIVTEAGGNVCDFSKNNNYVFGKEIIATNSNVFDEFSTKINDIFNK
jgi:myo-inositol-1(or 4)-monophosphatase